VQVRTVLLGAARALDAGGAAGAGSLAVSRVWVDGAGRVRFLPVALDPGEPPAATWDAFLRRLAAFGLEGRPPSDPAAAVPRANIPEHVRPFLARLFGAGPAFGGPAEAAAELEELALRPAEVTRSQRAATLALPLSPIAVIGVIVLAVLLVVRRVAPELEHLGEIESQARVFQELERPGSPEDKRRAVRVVLSDTFAKVRHPEERNAVLSHLSPATRAALETSHREYPDPSPREVAAARLLLGDDHALNAQVGGSNVGLSWSSQGRNAVMELAQAFTAYLGALGLCSAALSLWLRAGPGLALLGLTLQRADGSRVSRRRALVRTLLAWLPCILSIALTARKHPGAPAVAMAAAAAVVVGTVWAVRRPDRGLADRLADTRLVLR
jgi:hypothetical protein